MTIESLGDALIVTEPEIDHGRHGQPARRASCVPELPSGARVDGAAEPAAASWSRRSQARP